MNTPVPDAGAVSRRAIMLGSAIVVVAAPAVSAQEAGRVYRLGFVVQPPKEISRQCSASS
jgi:hypothetical protein